MAALLWRQGQEAAVITLLLGTAVSPPIPAANGNWGLGLGAQNIGGIAGVGGSGNVDVNNGTSASNSIAEIGQVSGEDGGYNRKSITRNASGWPTTGVSSGAFRAQSGSFTWLFTGVPNLGNNATSPATLWFVAKSTTKGAVDCIFGQDLQGANRSFNPGDTEQLTVAYGQTS